MRSISSRQFDCTLYFNDTSIRTLVSGGTDGGGGISDTKASSVTLCGIELVTNILISYIFRIAKTCNCLEIHFTYQDNAWLG